MLFWVYAEMKSVSDWFTTCVKISPRTYVLSLVNARRLIRPHFPLLSGLYFRNRGGWICGSIVRGYIKGSFGFSNSSQTLSRSGYWEEEEKKKLAT